MPNPTVRPFLSGADLLARAQQEAGWATELSDLRQNAAEQHANTDFGLRQLVMEQEKGASSITEGAISRGLFRSTVREGALADLTADIGIRSDALKSAAKAADDRLRIRQQQITSTERPAFYAAQNTQAVENARGLNADSPYAVEPQPATPATRSTSPTPRRRPSRERRILTSWRRHRRPGASQRRANLARRRLNARRRRARHPRARSAPNGPVSRPTPAYAPSGSSAPNAAGRR